MNPQERQLVDELFERLSKLESAPRDADAVNAINQGLGKAPNALYPLVQTVLVQDEALKRATARIAELEGQSGSQQTQGGGFLDSMRGALFGQQQKSGSVPSVPAGGDRPAWNTGAVYQSDPRNQPLPPQADPRAQTGGGGFGGSFLGTAAAAAVGVVGGSMLANSIGGLMGGHRQGFGDAASMGRGDSGSPWSGDDKGKSELAREAGLNDIGRSNDRTQDAAGSRQGFFDQASNEDHDDDEDYDSDDDSDSGDSDYA
jgi:hypothetical protein